ncbi:MAG: arylformamidase, partial [Verrucomicrobiota bacterium]
VDLTGIFSQPDRNRQIRVADLEASAASIEQTKRLLLKTGVWKDSKTFPDWIPVIAPDVAAWLQKRRVKLIGLDLPSVDSIEAKILVNHHALGAVQIVIVESLDLCEIAAGIYHFAALPLKIAGGDAAPVRAVLWRD